MNHSRVFLLAGLLFSFAPISVAQESGSDLQQYSKAERRARTQEDWTTPNLATSHLEPQPTQSTGVAQHDGYTTELVRLQWRFADPIDVYVIRPKGVPKPPVVLYLYGHDTDTDKFANEQFARGATQDGFAAVGFVSALAGQRFHSRPMKEWFVSELQESLAVSSHDVQMVLNYLASRGDLDTERVGLFAENSGASIAILAAAVDPRIKVLDVVDPWGDWPEWLAGSPVVPNEERADYITPDFLAKVAGLDPVQWLPKIHAQLRYQDALFAESSPRNVKEVLRAAVPHGTTVVVYSTPQDAQPMMQGTAILRWMHEQLSAPVVNTADLHSSKSSPSH